MSDTDTLAARQVAALFSRGRLTAIPRKPARRAQLLEHLAHTLFEHGRVYTEREVNDALRTVHEDCSALRRYMVVADLLERPRDGSSYRRGSGSRDVPAASAAVPTGV
ncbi:MULTISPECIES: DUF2087 domain-containing protein [unclassified Streptomyces]|uniref:DUF2087 domain-containing protein n=1 Tax=unclassified Streptomyces TaxID=2593676 RepID=UPI00093AA8C2|nr:DUF2087 domain-containing protein [Streptomyces sp. CB02058]OKI88829.1 hypothetical protein AMK10_31460 [Streptomyces sp. CB02058]